MIKQQSHRSQWQTLYLKSCFSFLFIARNDLHVSYHNYIETNNVKFEILFSILHAQFPFVFWTTGAKFSKKNKMNSSKISAWYSVENNIHLWIYSRGLVLCSTGLQFWHLDVNHTTSRVVLCIIQQKFSVFLFLNDSFVTYSTSILQVLWHCNIVSFFSMLTFLIKNFLKLRIL